MSNTKSFLKDFIYITIGTLLVAFGINAFLLPCKLSAGGVGSIATILFYFFKIPLSVTNLAFNAVLFALAYKFIGKGSVVKTVLGVILLSLFLEVTKYFAFSGEDVFMSSIIGGVLLGFGLGLVICREGSTGGSDLAGLVIKRLIPHLSVATIILVIDCIIIIISGIVFKSFVVTFYSALSMFVASKIADWVLTFGNASKCIYIISEKNEEISQKVITHFDRGITGLKSVGMYSGSDSLMLMCVVSPKEVPYVVNMVRNIDKKSFVVVTNAHEVLGEGFQMSTEYDKIQKTY